MTLPMFEPPEWPVVLVLREVKGWQADEDDIRYVRDLMRRFPKIDLLGEAQNWRDWMRDFRPRRRVKLHARFTRWCTIAAAPRTQVSFPVRPDPPRVNFANEYDEERAARARAEYEADRDKPGVRSAIQDAKRALGRSTEGP